MPCFGGALYSTFANSPWSQAPSNPLLISLLDRTLRSVSPKRLSLVRAPYWRGKPAFFTGRSKSPPSPTGPCSWAQQSPSTPVVVDYTRTGVD
jgi:hypothetical protein